MLVKINHNDKLYILNKSRRMFMYTNITEKELVNQFGITARDLRNIYQKYVGLPPKSYITRVKMAKAKTLLRTTTQSIIDIALYLGYENPSHMSAKFKEFYSLTPSAYRRMQFSLAS